MGTVVWIPMTPKPHKPMSVHIRRVLAWPSSIPPVTSAPSQCRSGKIRSQKPRRRSGAPSETASITPPDVVGSAFGTRSAPASSGCCFGSTENTRQDFSDRVAKHGVRDAVEGRRQRVDDHHARAGTFCGGNGARDRVDLQAGAYRDEQIGFGGRVHRAVD